MQNIQGGCTAPTGWGLHWLTAFPAQDDQWNQSRGSAYNSEDWRGGRVKLIPANSGLHGISPICFYRMKITLVQLYLAVTRFQKRRGRAALGGDFKRSLFPLLGLIPPVPLPPLPSLGRIQPHEGAPIFPSISKHIGKWVSLRYHLHASLAGSLWKRIQTHHACVKTEISICFFFLHVQIMCKWRVSSGDSLSSLFHGGFFHLCSAGFAVCLKL